MKHLFLRIDATWRVIRASALPACAWTAAALLAGCATSTEPRPASEQRAAPAPPAQTASAARGAKPDINEQFRNPNLEVSTWVERFESEGREIYDHRHEIIEKAEIRPGMAVADIGAGTGLFTTLMAKAVGPEGKVYAVDIVAKFLDYIQDRALDDGLRNIQTVLCTERSVELPAESIDLAFLCDTYHHFEFPEASLASIHEALRPGGEFILVEFHRIPGVSSDWILDHVRAGKEVFTREIEAAGFEKVTEYDFLKENYMIRFRKK